MPPSGQLRRPSFEIEEEIRNLRMELERHRDYGRQDQETIQLLEHRLAVERQLGYAEGLAQAAQEQLRTTSRGHSPPWYYHNDDYVCDLQRAAEDS